jgi:S-adenosylmethionine:tRNA ribosyltransferase-isomerase
MERLSDYDYDLPASLIAQTPLDERSASRLLHLHRSDGALEDRAFRDVVEILQPGDLLVMNNTRVTALRLFGNKPTGGEVEALLLRETSEGVFEALLKPAKRLKPGSRISFEGGLGASVVRELAEPLREIAFDLCLGWRDRLHSVGQTPLPPYIIEVLHDQERYQTVYAEAGGSGAAPTAGLHFTPELLDSLREKGVQIAFVTLDVSLDTFRPVTSENLADHKMHGEVCSIPPETATAVQKAPGRIIAVGTTTARTLESFAAGRRKVGSGSKTTSIFIRPGYEFQILDGMFTNFHMPRTTMLAMISALAGRPNIMRSYAHAIQHRYRFLSFGDSMLIL